MGLRFDLHGGGHTLRQHYPLRHLVDMDAYRNALRQAHPGEDRVDVGEALPIGLRVRNINAAGDAVDMAAQDLRVTHQLYVSTMLAGSATRIGSRLVSSK
jgi:hypothetical protein